MSEEIIKPMWQDPIIAEVRRIREAYIKRFNYDLQALYNALKEQEERNPRPKVSFPPKQVKSLQATAPAKIGRQPQFVYEAPEDPYAG